MNTFVARAIARQVGCHVGQVQLLAGVMVRHPSCGDFPLSHFLNLLRLEANIR